MRWIAAVLLGWMIAIGGSAGSQAQEPLRVIVTIKPVHSLVAALMDGAGEHQLLVKGASSAHSYAMRPSEARALAHADMVIRVSPFLESFAERPIANLAVNAQIVTLAEISGIELLPPRESGEFEAHEHEEHAAHGAGEEGHHAHETSGDGDHHDPHLWLSPANAAIIADHIAALLAKARPAHSALFHANARALKEKLTALDEELRKAVEPLQGKNFIVFHDAYQYFEHHYGLAASGAITISPERQPGAARLSAIRAKIEKLAVPCVFSEPQFEPKLVATLVEGTGAKTGTLDPLGAALPDGPDLYFTLMRNLAGDLHRCLS